MSEYWLISAPGDKTMQQTWETMNNITSKQNNLCVNYKFHIPDLKVSKHQKMSKKNAKNAIIIVFNEFNSIYFYISAEKNSIFPCSFCKLKAFIRLTFPQLVS